MVLGSSQFLMLPQNMAITSKVTQILPHEPKSVTLSVLVWFGFSFKSIFIVTHRWTVPKHLAPFKSDILVR